MSRNQAYVTIPGMGNGASLDIDDIITQVTGGGVPQREAEEPGVLSQVSDTASAIITGAPLVARGIGFGWENLWSGFDPSDAEARKEREAYERDLAAYQAKYKDSGTVPQWFAEAAGSSGQSLVGTGSSLLGMAAGIPGGLAGMAGGAALAGGAAAARMDYAEASRQLHEETTRRMGREPTDAEWQGILADMRPYLLKHAAIEGLGEGAGDAVLGLAFRPLSPLVKAAGEAAGRTAGGRLLRGAGALGAGIGSEIVTETGQQWGEGHVEADMFGTQAPTLGESFEEVAGPTAAQTVMTGGLMGGMRLGLNALRNRRAGTGEEREDGQSAGFQDTAPEQSPGAMSPAEPYVFEQRPEHMPVPVHAVEPDEIIYEGDFIDGAIVSPPSGRDAQLRIDDGKPVDLLGLPVQPGGYTARGFGDMAALEEGTGAIPMGSDHAGLGTITLPTDFSTPVATPYQPRMALPTGGGETTIQPGLWAGGRSQLASASPQFWGGQARGMAQGIGGMWGVTPGRTSGQVGTEPAVGAVGGVFSIQSSPTAGGGGEVVPRADTQAPARALGLPNQNAFLPADVAVHQRDISSIYQKDLGDRRTSSDTQDSFAWQKRSLPAHEVQVAYENVRSGGGSHGLERQVAAGNQGRTGKDAVQEQGREGGAAGIVSGYAEGRRGKSERRATSVKIPNRDAEPVTYELMEADEIQPSHLPEYSFEKNPRYALENERRYHDEPASRRKVLENAARLDPDFVLKDSVDANNGAPVVDLDGNVLGGNGRAMSIRQAYLRGGEKADAYRSALKSRIAELDMDPAAVDAMRQPILVRRLSRQYSLKERQALVTAMNDSFTDSKNTRASGKTRGDRLSRRSLEMLAEGMRDADSLRQYFDEPRSVSTVEQLIRDGVLLPTERNAYVGADGLLNPDGKRVIEEALRGRIARNYDALARLPADVVGKLDAVIPSVLIAERMGGEWNITDHLRDSIDLLAEFRSSGIREAGVFLGQVNMLTGITPNERYSARARQFFQLALDEKKAAFVERFRRYAAHARLSDGIPGASLSVRDSMQQFFGFASDMVPAVSDKKLSSGEQRRALLQALPEELRQKYRGAELSKLKKLAGYQSQKGENLEERDQTGKTGAAERYGTVESPDTIALATHFSAVFLSGRKFSTIVEARREAGALLGGSVQPATSSAKAVDEAVELGVTLAARRIIADMRERRESDTAIYRALVDLYLRQPRLGVRTSTSMAQQAYSTPAPIAFLASRLAGIDSTTRVYEPTAGNGMLLIEANPKHTTANELNADRAARLRSQGFRVSERDAVDAAPSGMDVVIANPPFGRVKDDNRQTVTFSVNGLNTKELDHAIVARSLGALKDHGRAVLIIGGKQGDDTSRSKKYRATEQVAFWNWLFEHYKVLEHFSVDGKLYERQGAGYPIDIVVLENSGSSRGRVFPGAALPRSYTSFGDLEEVLDGQVVDATEREPGHDGSDTGRVEAGSDSQPGRTDRVGDPKAGDTDSGRGLPGRDIAPDGTQSGERLDSGVRDDRPGKAGRGRVLGNQRPAGESRDDVSADAESRRAGGTRPADLAADSQRRNTGERSRRDDAGRLGERSDRGDVRPELGVTSSSRQQKVGHNKPKDTEFQVAYEPASTLQGMGTLVPRNMATAARQAMADLEWRHGNIDQYVADQLGYPAEDLGKYFAAEQVDALGMAISNIADGSGFIIGDQTGIGKGRVNAGIIRWAKRQGYIPVFVTMKPDLYADMVRDLADIGMEGFNPLPTNTGLSGDKAIRLSDGRILTTRGKEPHEQLLRDVMESGLGEYDAVFTTYDQLNAVKGKDTFRRTFLVNIAPQAVFILDESHNAGGQASTRKKASDADDRAQFVRKMLKASNQGAFYSSATYAKRPDVMSLYFKTDMQYAAEDMGKLAEAIEGGGIPMQQVVAAELTATGQYLRRERSFEGAEVQTSTVTINKDRAEKTAAIMRAIMAFDDAKEAAVDAVDKEAAKTGGSVGDNKSTGKGGASSTNFTAVMHNVIAQSLLAQKVDAVVEAAANDVARGEKVVIALSNTMGSMIEEFAEQNDISVGSPIHFTFNDMFIRYLEKSRMIAIKDAGQKVAKEKRRLTDEELGPDGVQAYNNALAVIRGSDFGDLPVSVIDRMLAEFEARGIKAGEITGRTERIDYTTDVPTYAKRTTGPSDRIRVVDEFNSGKLDVVILNQSGSTGISLHSSERFKDQRRRNMIIAQPEANIDVFMQTLGRVFRTGQVVPPTYQLIMSDLPAEKRPAAILAKKMSSLNANTTASKESDTTFKEIPDFLNRHGDRVAAQVMEDNPDLHRKMGYPLKDGKSIEDAMRKVTGRIPLLSVQEQRKVYELLESEYKEYIAQLEAMGGAGLEAKSLPLDARLISEIEIVPAKEVGKATPFAGAARLGTYDVKKLGKPWPSSQVKEMARAAEVPDMEQLRRDGMAWHKKKARELSAEVAEKQLSRLKFCYRTISEAAQLRPGTPVLISGKDILLEGILLRLYHRGGSENPLALGAWKMDIALPDASRKLTIPLSQTVRQTDAILVRESYREPDVVYALFDSGQNESREKAYIITGNILAAFQKVGRGKVVTFQDHKGNTLPGIMLPKDTNPERIAGELDVSLSPGAAIRFLSALPGKATVKTADKLFAMSYDGDTYSIAVPASKAKGAQYFLNGAVLEAAGKDFFKAGQSMVLRNLSEAQALSVMEALSDQGYGFVADNNRDEARTVMASTEEKQPVASLASRSARHLPPRQKGRRGMRASAVQDVVDRLNVRAAEAGAVRVVQTAQELPARIRGLFEDQLDAIEGVYDPATATVWMVADNIASLARAAEVWAHEQIGHHGLRGLFTQGERKRLLNQLWLSMGGMGNASIRDIAERYGLNPRGVDADRQAVMEELVAQLAEKRQAAPLTAREQTLWHKIVAAIHRAWRRLIKAVTGRDGRMDYSHVEELLADLGEYVWTGRGREMQAGAGMTGAEALASQKRTAREITPEAEHAAWEQLQTDLQAWGQLVEAFRPSSGGVERQPKLMTVCRTPDVLQRLGALDLPMTISADNLAKILSTKVDHNIPKELVKQLPKALAEPVMVFESATAANSFVVLTELKHEGRSVMVAVHLDTERQRIRVNDIASAYRRGNEAWYIRQIEDGRLLYQDKQKSLAWARTNRLQLPRVRRLPARLSEGRILTETDAVKPVEHPELAAMASRRTAGPQSTPETEHAAWEQLQTDLQAWGQQLDAFASKSGNRIRPLQIGNTPDVLVKLGAKQLPMQMEQRNLTKILTKHGITLERLRDLPEQLANPLMVFRSSTMANAYVVLTEMEQAGENLVAAVHFDVERGRIRVNDVASIHDRSVEREGKTVPGWVWFKGQIEKGNLRYYDKKRSPRWFRERAGLQLSSVVNQGDYRGVRILTETDVVKPVEHPELRAQRTDGDTPRASLAKKTDSRQDTLGFFDKLFTLDMRKTAELTDAPEIRSFFHEDDLGLLGHFLALPHWIAKRSPAFARVYDRQLRRDDERAAALKKSLEQVPSLFGRNRLGKQDMESLRAILWQTEGTAPKELEGVTKFLSAGRLDNGRTRIAVNPAFYQAYAAWVDSLDGTEAAKKALIEIRKSLDNDLVLAHNRMAAMGEMSDDAIRKFRQNIGHVPNYFPHHRYGRYYIQAKIGDEVVFRQHFDAATKARAMLKARQIAAEQARHFPGATWSRGDNVRLPDEVLGAPIDTEAMEQIIRAATAKIADRKQAGKIAALLMEGTADVLKARGWGAHSIQRKGVPGFEKEDLARVLYDYKAGLNGWLTKMEAARDFGDALRAIDARQTPELWKYASQYVKDMLRNSDRIDRISGNIKSVAFAWYLGGSIKTAMVNLTQNIVVGVPRLQMDVTDGAGAWIRGAHRAIAHRVTGGRAGGLTAEEARLLQELDGENVITDAYMEEIRGQLGSTSKNLWNRFTKALGWPMSEVERFNRASLALAAFRAARAGKMKVRAQERYGVTGRASYEQAKAFAADVVKDAHFVYGKSNLPEFLRSNAAGRAMSSMYTFRSFTFNMLGMWLWALRTQGREGAAFAARSLGATMALGGVTSLPFYATAMALYQMVSGDDDDWTEQIRKALPQNSLLRDVVCYGMPAMAGVNIGGSLQMETGLTRGLQRGRTPKEVLTESIGDLVGIPYDLAVEKPSRVMEASRHGDVWRMVEEAAPVALKNTMQAWRLMTEGQTTMSGRPVNNPGERGARKLTGGEALGKALGFQPVSSSKSYTAYAARQHATQVKDDMLDELAVLYLRSYDTGNPEGRLEARRRMRAWNARMVAEGKTGMLIREKDVLRRVKARRRENRLTPKTARQRAEFQGVWG